jgi:hypothetical protein
MLRNFADIVLAKLIDTKFATFYTFLQVHLQIICVFRFWFERDPDLVLIVDLFSHAPYYLLQILSVVRFDFERDPDLVLYVGLFSHAPSYFQQIFTVVRFDLERDPHPSHKIGIFKLCLFSIYRYFQYTFLKSNFFRHYPLRKMLWYFLFNFAKFICHFESHFSKILQNYITISRYTKVISRNFLSTLHLAHQL